MSLVSLDRWILAFCHAPGKDLSQFNICTHSTDPLLVPTKQMNSQHTDSSETASAHPGNAKHVSLKIEKSGKES